MSIIPTIRPSEMVRVLLRAGFRIVRQTGSHIRLEKIADPGVYTSVPQHSGDLPRWLTAKIIKQSGLSTKEFLELLG